VSEYGPADWGKIRAKPGQYACPEHGIVEPKREIVPACPAPGCPRAVHLAVKSKLGVVWQEPRPDTCGCPGRHRIGPGHVSLGARACTCTTAGAHRTWTAWACGTVQQWPPHEETTADPYYGPGSGISQ
jgi:hypothetical protein